MEREKEKVFDEVDSISSEPKKNEFINGCLELEKELNLKNQGSGLKKIWFTVPPKEKRGEDGEYNERLEKEVKEEIRRIIPLK